MFISLISREELSTDLMSDARLIIFPVIRKRRRHIVINIDHKPMWMYARFYVLSWEQPDPITVNLIGIWKTLYFLLGATIFWVFNFLDPIRNISLHFIQYSQTRIRTEILIECQDDIPMQWWSNLILFLVGKNQDGAERKILTIIDLLELHIYFLFNAS